MFTSYTVIVKILGSLTAEKIRKKSLVLKLYFRFLFILSFKKKVIERKIKPVIRCWTCSLQLIKVKNVLLVLKQCFVLY